MSHFGPGNRDFGDILGLGLDAEGVATRMLQAMFQDVAADISLRDEDTSCPVVS
jgi:hypothetical protein